MDFSTARNLGLIGSILFIVGIILSGIPWIGELFSLLGLAGFILVLVSLYFFSKIYAEPRIFRDALISVIVAIAGLIVAILLLLILVSLGVTFIREVRSSFPGASSEVSLIFGTDLGSILVFLVAFAISAFFWYRALNTLSRASGEGLFRLAGLLCFIGILLLVIGVFTVIILVGFVFFIVLGSLIGLPLIFLGVIAWFVSWIVLAVAFYNIKQPQQTPTQPAMPAVPA